MKSSFCSQFTSRCGKRVDPARSAHSFLGFGSQGKCYWLTLQEKEEFLKNPEIGIAQRFLSVEYFAVRQVLKDTGISCGAEFVVPDDQRYWPCSHRLPLDLVPKILYAERFSWAFLRNWLFSIRIFDSITVIASFSTFRLCHWQHKSHESCL